MSRLIAAVLLLGIAVPKAVSQTKGVDHSTQAQLTERAQALKTRAAGGDGSAAETLHHYTNHFTMLSYRDRSGGGELHEDFADIFYVVDGHAMLETGGRIVEGKTISPGEIRGSSVEKGIKQELNKGDIVHIPAGTPHQLLIAPGESFTYFVVKVLEER